MLLLLLVQGWDSIMADVADVRRVLFLDCPADVLRERLLSRGLSSGRTDDNLETANRRLETFVETTLPVSHPPCLLQFLSVLLFCVCVFCFVFFVVGVVVFFVSSHKIHHFFTLQLNSCFFFPTFFSPLATFLGKLWSQLWSGRPFSLSPPLFLPPFS